jgi:hypothetical protein
MLVNYKLQRILKLNTALHSDKQGGPSCARGTIPLCNELVYLMCCRSVELGSEESWNDSLTTSRISDYIRLLLQVLLFLG